MSTQKTDYTRRLKMISSAVSMISKGLASLHTTSVECLQHAKDYGDVTLCAKLVQEVKTNCKGVVVAGLNKWMKDHSPVRLSTDDKGNVSGKLLKEGDAGYKPFDIEGATKAPAMETADVANRANRPIEEMSVKLLKARLKGLQDQIKKAGEKDGRGYFGSTPEEKIKTKTQCETLMNSVLATVDKINFLGPVANAVEAATGTPDRKSRSRSRAKTVAEAAAGTESQVKAA